ncbi:hypothetical protein PsorP6_001863 [Peronosclerospora sorghi]|uniref:Uncharacterized protein n=1 Tax=Peronosclerospora sorghi TaxID=230839 RepID=A0ACC0WT39_9STRA|nr:hypothetical protein PsorP6_001863 [Peronosclerospora sorghi]
MVSLSNDMERLMKEQSELAQLREQLEESKRKLQSEDISESAVQSASLTAQTPRHEEHASSFAPSSFALASLSSSSTVSTSSSTWTPPKLYLVPSLPQPTVVPTGLPLALFPSSRTAHTNPSFSSPYSSLPASGSSVYLENGLIRLQRSSTTIESTLQGLQSKLDRLLNSQHSIKSTKFTGTSVKFSGSASFSSVLSSSSSSSMLLKNLEKALTQRDQLQEHTTRLEEANAELEQ